MSKKHKKTKGKPMIFKNRSREKVKKSPGKQFVQRCPRLKNAVKNNMKSRFFVVRDEKMTPKVPTAQKCCKKQYEIKIFVVRDQKMT